MGVLLCWGYHCQWSSCRACEEPQLCCLGFLHDWLHLSSGCGMDLGWWLAVHPLWRGIYGFCRVRRDIENEICWMMFDVFWWQMAQTLSSLQVVPGRAGGGSFRRKKNYYIAKKEFAYKMCARRPTSAMPKPFLCCERAFCCSVVAHAPPRCLSRTRQRANKISLKGQLCFYLPCLLCMLWTYLGEQFVLITWPLIGPSKLKMVWLRLSSSLSVQFRSSDLVDRFRSTLCELRARSPWPFGPPGAK